MSKEKSTNQELEMEVLKAKIEALTAKAAPKNSEELFQERIAKYESSLEKRKQEKAEIEKMKMEVWSSNPRLRQDEVMVIVGMKKRAEALKGSNPEYVARLENAIREIVKNANEDLAR